MRDGFPLDPDHFRGHSHLAGDGEDDLAGILGKLSDSAATVTTGELHVYADGTSGSDANDGLSVGAPKKTLGAVFALVPDIIRQHVAIHLSGTFAYSSWDTLIITSNANKNVVIDGGDDLTVVADNGGSPWSADIHSTTSIGLTTWGKATDQYAGYWVEITSGPAAGDIRTIHGNSTTTITPTANFSVDPGVGAGFRIVRPTTTISRSATSGIYFVANGSQIYVQRLYFGGAAGSFNVGAAGTSAGGQALTCSAIINNVSTSTALYSRLGLNLGTLLINPTNFGYLSNKIGCSFLNSSCVVHCDDGMLQISGSVFLGRVRNAGQLFNFYGSRASHFWDLGGQHRAESAVIWNNSSYANNRLGGHASLPGLLLEDGALQISGLDVSDSPTHGIVCVNSRLFLDGVITGSGNTGAGVYAHSGSVVHITDGSPPTLTGTVGDLSTDGTTQKSTWAAIDAGTPVSDTAEMTMAKEV